jgi:spermidine synthase
MNDFLTDARRRRYWRRAAALVLASGALAYCSLAWTETEPHRRSYGGGAVEWEGKSAFSRIRIRRQGNVRTLLFVGDRGEEVVESAVDLDRPHQLLVPYSRVMFASYLFRPKQQRVLIVGLGGGSMVHFLQHYAPQLQIDVAEIDPVIVKIADTYFGVRAGGNLRISAADGRDYLQSTRKRYDVIYMDAFLRPRPETDSVGVPLRLKTSEFLKGVRTKLNPDGVAVFNLHSYEGTEGDLSAMGEAFPQLYTFQTPGAGNLVVVASQVRSRERLSVLESRAKELDRTVPTDFSFQDMLKNLQP